MSSSPRVATLRQDDSVGAPPREPAPGVVSRALPTHAAKNDESVWRPIFVKALSLGAGMLGLAAIGMFSTLREANSGQLLQARNDDARGGVATREASLLPAPPWGSSDSNAATPTNSARQTHHAETAPTTAPEASASSPGPAAQSGITADGKVILNIANVQELDTLPGVGKKTAERIVELRTRLGRFKKLSDLLRIKGIGQRSLQKLTPHLLLDPPAAAVPSAPSSSVKAE